MKNMNRNMAEDLLSSMATGLDGAHGFSTFSASTYDTAWVAMVERPGSNGSVELGFPECFNFLLQTQQADGSWKSESGSILDGILNTMAALLALQKRVPRVSGTFNTDLVSRCAKAKEVLVGMLRSWDIASCDRVGFEVILPALMRLLEQYGYHFEKEMPGKHGKSLTELYEKKVSKLFPVLFSETPTTLIHSLEAFAGSLDYDKVKHHRSPRGDMLGSPSSTAAYLKFAPTWDEEAFEYLRSVITAMAPQTGKGGVPSAFPTHIFEITWVLTTLLEAGFTVNDLGEESVSKVKNYLLGIIEAQGQGGIIGFAPHALPDADDSSMAISVISLLGGNVGVDYLLAQFETPTHFVSYQGERNASFSVNCNVLLCLLRRKDVSLFTSQAVKAASFLAQLWYESKVKDKWNTSEYYPMMLLAKAFVMFLTQWESKGLDRSKVSEDFVQEKVPVILLDILLKILDSQAGDGSWSHQREPTAYATLALAAIRRLPWVESLAPEIQSRVKRGSDYLLGCKDLWRHGDHIWIEKIAYSSSNLSLAYCLAATKSAESMEGNPYLGQEVSGLLLSSPKMIKGFQKFFSTLPAFSKNPPWKLELLALQAFQFSRRLGRSGLDVLMHKDTGETKYLTYIPFTWISIANGSQRMSLSSQWEMMVCSLLNYQIDNFIEHSVNQEHNESILHLKSVTRRLCTSQRIEFAVSSIDEKNNTKRKLDEYHDEEQLGNGEPSPPESEADEANRELEDKLGQFVNHYLRHPSVVPSPAWMQTWLAQQLQNCVLAHLTHLQDCKKYAGSSPPVHGQATKPWTYFDWVHSTPAEHTTAKFSFVFYLCLVLGENGDKLLGKSEKDKASYFPRYVAEDMCVHLAAMCRQQNDYGSLARDRAEGNLQSADFSDLYLGGVDADGHKDAHAKKMLLDVAAYERSCVENAMTELGKYLDTGVMDVIRVFIEVTDLYGQIYIVRDLTARG